MNYIQRFANMEKAEAQVYFFNLLVFLKTKADFGLVGGLAQTLWKDWQPYADAMISQFGLKKL